MSGEGLDSKEAAPQHVTMHLLATHRILAKVALVVALLALAAPGGWCFCASSNGTGPFEACANGGHSDSGECPCGRGCGPCVDAPFASDAQLSSAGAIDDIHGQQLSSIPLVQPAALSTGRRTSQLHLIPTTSAHSPPYGRASHLILII